MSHTPLTPHFTLEELCVTSTGLPNVPPESVVNRLRLLATYILEPLRFELGGKPIHVNSGYRSDALNAAVGGAGTSMHKTGEAADIYVSGLTPVEVARVVWALARKDGTSFTPDQCILYPQRGFVHVSYTHRRPNRGEYMSCIGSEYTFWGP